VGQYVPGGEDVKLHARPVCDGQGAGHERGVFRHDPGAGRVHQGGGHRSQRAVFERYVHQNDLGIIDRGLGENDTIHGDEESG